MKPWIEKLFGPIANVIVGIAVRKRLPDLNGDGSINYSEIDHLTDKDWRSLDAELTQLLDARNDRGVATAFHAMLEDRLRWAMEQRMISALSAEEKSALFKGAGALTTYAAKVRVAYAFGLISKLAHDEFLLLGKIRNLFAHEFRQQTFENPEIKDMCRRLNLEDGDDQLQRYAKCCFIGTVSMLAVGGMAHTPKAAGG